MTSRLRVGTLVISKRLPPPRYGFSYFVIMDRALDTVAPIVSRLAGK